MKKIFYLLVSAIVALGAVACQNDIDENLVPEQTNDYSITVNIADTRVSAGEVTDGTIPLSFDNNDVVYISRLTETGWDATILEITYDTESRKFKFANANDYNTYIGWLDSNTTTQVRFDYTESSYHISNAGLDGLPLYAIYKAGEELTTLKSSNSVTLTCGSAVLMFTANANTEITFSSSDAYPFGVLENDENSITITATGETQYVPVETGEYTLSYSIGANENIKSVTRTWAVNTFYNLGTLADAVASVDGKMYTDLSEAITAANGAGEVVTLLADNLTVPAACQIDATNVKTFSVATGYKAVDNGDGTYSVVEKEAYRVYVLNQGGWATTAFHSWNDSGDLTGGWATTTLSKKESINGFDFYYYEYDKSLDGTTVNYIIFNKDNDYFRAEYNNIVLNSNKYYRINAVGALVEVNPNDLSTYQFALYVYDQNSVNGTHSLYYNSTASGTAVTESGRVGVNYKNYDYFVLDGSKIGTNFVVSVSSPYNSTTKSIANLSISKDIKTDLCIGYWNNSGNAGYWANNGTPYTYLLNN